MIPRHHEIFLRAARAEENYEQQRVDPPPADVPTRFDVLNGRGQGVQRHPGNVAYRKLVFSNKGLYAECPAGDKAKIAKGIVAAIRGRGGRFLEWDRHTGACVDIGDRKAWEKTSQALREGQAKIRRQLHGKGAMTVPRHAYLCQVGFVPSEGYFRYSAIVLESLWSSEGAGDDASQTLAASQGARSPSFAPTPRSAPGSGPVAQTPLRPQVSPSSSPDLESEKSRAATRVEDEIAEVLASLSGSDGAGGVASRTWVARHDDRSPSFPPTPRLAPFDGPVAETLGRPVLQSVSPDPESEDSHVAARVEDEIRYLTQMYRHQLALSLVRRMNPEEHRLPMGGMATQYEQHLVQL